jgi:hypothetical protein
MDAVRTALVALLETTRHGRAAELTDEQRLLVGGYLDARGFLPAVDAIEARAHLRRLGGDPRPYPTRRATRAEDQGSSEPQSPAWSTASQR